MRTPAPATLLLLSLLPACQKDKDSAAQDSAAALASAVADAGPDQAATVGDVVLLDGSGSTGVSFSWDPGDGSGPTDAALAEHVYTAPGEYAAVITVTGEDGGWRSDVAVITVTAPATAVAPVWSRPVLRVADTLWVVTPEANTVSVLDAASGALLEAFSICTAPRTLSYIADRDEVAIACEGEDRLLVLEASTRRNKSAFLLPDASRPYGVAGRDGAWWVALQSTGQLARIDADTGDTVLHTVGPDARGVALQADGRVLVTRFRATDSGAALYRYDPEADTTETLPLALDTLGDSDTTTGGVPNLLEQVVPSRDGSTLYVPTMHANVLRGLWRSGEALDFQTSLRAVLLNLDADTGAEGSLTDRKQFDERGRAIAVTPSPDGARLYVLHPGVGAVTALSATTQQIVGSILEVGTFPTGMDSSADGETLYIYAWLDRTVRAYDVSDLAAGTPAPLWETVVLETEPLSAEVLLGKRVFHNAADPRLTKSGYISCAHCHPDGRDDGLTWDFTDRGEGLRNTTSLEGRAGVGMGAIHWSGNFDEVQDFENDMRGAFGGTGFLSESDWSDTRDTLGTPKAGRSAELDALAAYLTSLDATPASPTPDADPSGGADALHAAGCTECHTPPHYTDSAVGVRHDVGTLTAASGQRLGGPLDGLDTPTLLGVWDTGPWLHDGSALTLEEAIQAHNSAAELDEATITRLADAVRGL